MKKISILLCIITLIFGASCVLAQAQTVSPTTNPSGAPTPTTDSSSSSSGNSEGQLEQQISDLQQKVSDLQSQGDTLSSQIDTMNSQIQLTQDRIDATQQQIMSLTMDIDSAGQRMSTLEGSLSNVTKVLLSHIVATYQAGSANDMQVLLSSSDISDLVTKANYLRFVEEHDRELLDNTEQARVDYANQKAILEDQKKQVLALNVQLQQYTTTLNSQKQAKQFAWPNSNKALQSYPHLFPITPAFSKSPVNDSHNPHPPAQSSPD